jgi:hypothetical protein
MVLSGGASVLKLGQVLTIDATVTYITAIDGVNVTLGNPVPTGTGLAIAYRNATFKEFGAIAA